MPSEPANDAASSADSTEGADKYATYCPEDNKLRLYVGWVERAVYERLREEGWSATPKQSCDFVAVWTPDRRDTAIELADVILDEDMGPAERAADRAERFSGYLERRLDEAGGHADRFDSGPAVHGFQSFAKAVRSADRHDRIAGRAVDAWEKAEYWTRRTEGVIRNALYKDDPGVRMGRINRLEAELRQCETRLADYRKTYDRWIHVSSMDAGETKDSLTRRLVDTTHTHREFQHPRLASVKGSLYSLLNRSEDPISTEEAISLWLSSAAAPKDDTDWTLHLKLRLAYEHQMLGQQGSVAAMSEIVVGGFVGSRRIHKVNRSPVTKRAISVNVVAHDFRTRNRWGTPYPEGVVGPIRYESISLERVSADAYRAPTEADLEEFKKEIEALKQEQPEKHDPPLINPTDDDALRLQDAWNAEILEWIATRRKESSGSYVPTYRPQVVLKMTQAQFSARSKGSYADFSTTFVVAGGSEKTTNHSSRSAGAAAICRVRRAYGDNYMAKRVIVITDKPQKPFPSALWNTEPAPAPAPEIAEAATDSNNLPAAEQDHVIPSEPKVQPEFSL